MAFKTSHRLSVKHYDDSKVTIEDDLIEEILEFAQYNDDLEWVISEGLFEWGESDRSFQNKDRIMKKLSLKYPQLMFTLEFEPIDDCRLGEITEYWFDGKVQIEYAEIRVNDFDISKLKEVKEI